MARKYHPIFSEQDFDRAIQALDLLFQDEELPAGDARFTENKLVEELHDRGISRALALSLIEQLITKRVFRAGKSFVNLSILVRFDGKQTDRVTPNRYLHTTRKNWYGFVTSRVPTSEKPVPREEPYSDVRHFAEMQLKGKGRRIVELLCTRGGNCPLAVLAADPAIEWQKPYDNCCNKALQRLNQKMRRKLPWRLRRNDNRVQLEPHPSTAENRSTKA